MKTLTHLPFLAAFFIAVAFMPTHVYQICARQVGTLELDPWRSKATDAVRAAVRFVTALFAALRSFAGGASPTFAAVALVLLVVLLTQDASGAMFAAIPAGLKALRQEAADIDAEIKASNEEVRKISTKVTSEKREMTPEERTQLASLKAKIADLKSLKETNTEMLTEAEAANERQRTETPVDDADATAAANAAAAARVRIGQDRSQNDPKKGFKSHVDFLKSVMSAGKGRKVDARLLPLKQEAAAGSDEAGEYSDPHGGFLVPAGFSPTLLQLQPESDPIAGRTRPLPMDKPVVEIPARVDKDHTTSVSGGLTVTRRPETVAANASRTQFEKVVMRAASLFGLSYATEEIMQDSPISFIALISSGFADEFTSKGIDERLNGSGVGEPEGIANSPALITVTKETGQAADTVNYENVKKMRSRCWGYNRAIWMANHDTMPELMSMVQVIGTGGTAIYQPSAQEDRPDLLLGRPIFYTEYTNTLGDAGDIVLVNWFEYLDGTYQPLESAESMHVRFVEHERAFKFWLRNDGRGWWRSALTPKKSAVTLSPFVRLGARA